VVFEDVFAGVGKKKILLLGERLSVLAFST
jgi:hypothetical protein